MSLEIFNELAKLLAYGDAINYSCWDTDQCELTMKFINSIVKRMNELLEEMEP